MRITVKFSGLLHILAGVEQEVLDVAEGTTVDRLAAILARKYPTLPVVSSKTYFVVNDLVSTRDRVLAEGDRLHIFQLLGGG